MWCETRQARRSTGKVAALDGRGGPKITPVYMPLLWHPHSERDARWAPVAGDRGHLRK